MAAIISLRVMILFRQWHNWYDMCCVFLMRNVLFLFIVVFLPLSSIGQRQARLTVPMQLEVGTNFAEFKNDSVRVFRQKPGVVLNLSAGLGFRVKQKFAMGITCGVLLDGYLFEGDGSSYDVFNLVGELRGHANYLFPTRNALLLYPVSCLTLHSTCWRTRGSDLIFYDDGDDKMIL